MNMQKPKSTGIFQNPLTVGLLTSFCCLLWGSAAVGVKLCYRYFGISANQLPEIILFSAVRFTLAGVFLFAFFSIKGKRIIRPSTPKAWKHIAFLVVVQSFLQYIFNPVGVANSSGVNASVLNASGSLLSIILACALYRQEKLTLQKGIGALLGMTGLVVMNLNGAGFGGFHFLGEGFMLLAGLCSAIGNCSIRLYSKDEDPITMTVYSLIIGGILLFAFGFLLGGKLSLNSLAGDLILLYLALLSAVAYALWNELLKHNDVSKVSVYGFLIPLFGVILSALVLGETEQAFRVNTLISLALVCVSIVLVSRKKK